MVNSFAWRLGRKANTVHVLIVFLFIWIFVLESDRTAQIGGERTCPKYFTRSFTPRSSLKRVPLTKASGCQNSVAAITAFLR